LDGGRVELRLKSAPEGPLRDTRKREEKRRRRTYIDIEEDIYTYPPSPPAQWIGP
jgi:hypothetical protein